MQFGNSAGNFGGSAVRQPLGHNSAAAMLKLVALQPNYMQIVQNWSEKDVVTVGPAVEGGSWGPQGTPRLCPVDPEPPCSGYHISHPHHFRPQPVVIRS